MSPKTRNERLYEIELNLRRALIELEAFRRLMTNRQPTLTSDDFAAAASKPKRKPKGRAK